MSCVEGPRYVPCQLQVLQLVLPDRDVGGTAGGKGGQAKQLFLAGVEGPFTIQAKQLFLAGVEGPFTVQAKQNWMNTQ